MALKPALLNFYALLLLPIALTWIRSSITKLSEGKFPHAMAASLQKFTANNPYGWYKSLLQNTAVPNATVFGYLIMWGEFLVAVLLLLGVVLLLLGRFDQKIAILFLLFGLAGGMLLNLLFWFASGWMSPSSDSLNLLMFGTELIAFFLGLRFLLS